VTDHYTIHQAKAITDWLATARFTLLMLPTASPCANSIERALGARHDLDSRHHQQKRIRDVVVDVKAHLHVNDPWP
jgi:hypothetical protein